jgi:hypothetical protein
MKGIDDIVGFDFSLGGETNEEWMNFNTAESIENWQIISPYRNDETSGSSTLNRYIHGKYRTNENNVKSLHKKRVTKNPFGNDSILYGDKVINIRNQDRSHKMSGYPDEGCENYIANGEIGIVNRIWQKPKDKSNNHLVMFSSQKGYSYRYHSSISEGDADLELAYALTVHKVQGSGFKITIFILNEPENGISSFLSRELLYTALTRQSDKVFVLYNKEPWELKKYSDACYSDLARRLTNLFDKPIICEHEGGWYDNNLIHITINNEKVRSKSEVIVANELKHAEIAYIYEKKLKLDDGSEWLPDFTLIMPDGREIYWEHLGMLRNRQYRQKWEYKKSVYEKNGISEKNGNLIISMDKSNGGIDASEVAEIIEYLNRKL